MTTLREAAQQALEALENGKRVRAYEGGTKYQPDLEDATIAALRAALAETHISNSTVPETSDTLPPLPPPTPMSQIARRHDLEYTADQMREYAAAAVAAERERCAIAAGAAADEIERLRHNNRVLTDALWKACGDDEETVNATIESQGELR